MKTTLETSQNFRRLRKIDFGVLEKMYEPMSMHMASDGEIGISICFMFEYRRNTNEEYQTIRANFAFGAKKDGDNIVLRNAEWIAAEMNDNDYQIMFDHFVKEFEARYRVIVDRELKKPKLMSFMGK